MNNHTPASRADRQEGDGYAAAHQKRGGRAGYGAVLSNLKGAAHRCATASGRP
jgi:hypothetical protein